jgi:hypothetical protein
VHHLLGTRHLLVDDHLQIEQAGAIVNLEERKGFGVSPGSNPTCDRSGGQKSAKSEPGSTQLGNLPVTSLRDFARETHAIGGGGADQHLTRLMDRARALEVLLSAEDYDAELAERYGWVNRALPADALGGFVRSLAHRIAGFPAAGRIAIKEILSFAEDGGLGLAITKRPVDELQGKIEVFSELGKGSRFVPTLPRTYPENITRPNDRA